MKIFNLLATFAVVLFASPLRAQDISITLSNGETYQGNYPIDHPENESLYQGRNTGHAIQSDVYSYCGPDGYQCNFMSRSGEQTLVEDHRRAMAQRIYQYTDKLRASLESLDGDIKALAQNQPPKTPEATGKINQLKIDFSQASTRLNLSSAKLKEVLAQSRSGSRLLAQKIATPNNSPLGQTPAQRFQFSKNQTMGDMRKFYNPGGALADAVLDLVVHPVKGYSREQLRDIYKQTIGQATVTFAALSLSYIEMPLIHAFVTASSAYSTANSFFEVSSGYSASAPHRKLSEAERIFAGVNVALDLVPAFISASVNGVINAQAVKQVMGPDVPPNVIAAVTEVANHPSLARQQMITPEVVTATTPPFEAPFSTGPTNLKTFVGEPDLLAKIQTFFGKGIWGNYLEAAASLKQQYPELAAIPDAELIALRGYTSGIGNTVNEVLWRGNAAELQRYEPFVKAASSALNRLPNYEGEVIRGVALKGSQTLRYEVGNIVEERGFTSTSTEELSFFKANVQFIIQSRTGKSIEHVSATGFEKEVLFAPGTRFKVTHRELDLDTGRIIIKMEEVP